MAEKSDGSPFTIPTTVILVAAAAVAWYEYVRPLSSARPPANETNQPAIGEQQIRARLWQDPFEAVAQDEVENPGAGYHLSIENGGIRLKPAPTDPQDQHRLNELRQRIQYRIDPPSEAASLSNVLLLPVMVSNAPYAEEGEWRRRCRYAVVSALFTAGYRATDSLHLGEFNLDWPEVSTLPTNTESAAKPAQSLRVPYEWFEREQPDKEFWQHVLVLWLDDDLFSDVPLSRTVYLLHKLLPENAEQSIARDPGPGAFGACVIGPDNSTTLKFALNDRVIPNHSTTQPSSPGPLTTLPAELSDRKLTSARIEALLRNTRWLCARATASNVELIKSDVPEPFAQHRDLLFRRGQPQVVSELPGTLAPSSPFLFQIRRTNFTDLQLMQSIVQELDYRGVDLRQHRDRVALITELDTVYGRAMQRAFVKAAADHWHGDFREAGTVSVHSYLRGLDGITGARATTDAASARATAEHKPANPGDALSAAAEAKVPMPPPEQPEQPDGNRQYDYMRRMAQALVREQNSYDPDDRGGGFRAIGVLGSDVYDKLLVLRALHDRFPRAIFFTTDLDDRLFQQQELASTQNLVVAGGYGLSLNRAVQLTVPPFRDGYQSATYASCLEALNFPAALSAVSVPAKPRIFEVSSKGFEDLTNDDDPNAINAQLRVTPGLRHRAWQVLVIVVMLGLAIWMLFPVLPRLRRLLNARSPDDPSPSHVEEITELRRQHRASDRAANMVWIAFLILLVLLLIGMNVDYAYHGKPLKFFAGISLWPTEILRLVAAFLAVFFIVRSQYAMRRNEYELSLAYGLPTDEKPFPGLATDPRLSRWARFWRRVRFLFLLRTVSSWENECDRYRSEGRVVPSQDRQPRQHVAGLWREYRWLGRWYLRLLRAGVLTTVFAVLATMIQWYWGPPFRPFRSPFSNYVDLGLMAVSGLAVILMTLWVVDALRLCEAFCGNLAGRQTPWDQAQLKPFSDERAMDNDDVQEWLDIQFIADRTSVVGRFIFYPFIVLALLIIGRSRLFDRWDWAVPLIVIFGVLCAYAIWCVLMLRRVAERARQDAIEQMSKNRVKLSKKRDPASTSRIEQLRLAIRAVRDNAKGAFAPLTQHPLIGAILIPASGAGALALIEFLTGY